MLTRGQTAADEPTALQENQPYRQALPPRNIDQILLLFVNSVSIFRPIVAFRRIVMDEAIAHSDHSWDLDTAGLRREFLVEGLFVPTRFH